jgi:hypothetical protein
MSFTSLLAHVARVFEGIGAGILVIVLIWSVVLAARTWRVAGGRRGYQVLREAFGAVLLLGLEIDGRPPWRRFTALGAAGGEAISGW